MLKFHLRREDLLERNKDVEYVEDSDYENEPDPTGHSVSQDIKVDSERRQRRGKKFPPVLTVGSRAA